MDLLPHWHGLVITTPDMEHLTITGQLDLADLRNALLYCDSVAWFSTEGMASGLASLNERIKGVASVRSEEQRLLIANMGTHYRRAVNEVTAAGLSSVCALLVPAMDYGEGFEREDSVFLGRGYGLVAMRTVQDYGVVFGPAELYRSSMNLHQRRLKKFRGGSVITF